MRKIFIDAGGYDGDTVQLFLEKYPKSQEFEIFCFEPNPEFKSFHKNKDYTFCPYAVWTEDCDLDFYVNSKSLGSSLLKNKYSKNGKVQETIKVRAINFSQWIKNNFNKDDFIVLKMDIEGAEYDVLKHMIDQDAIDYVKELYVDWHARKISGFDKTIHDNLFSHLVKIGLKPGNMCGETKEIKI